MPIKPRCFTKLLHYLSRRGQFLLICALSFTLMYISITNPVISFKTSDSTGRSQVARDALPISKHRTEGDAVNFVKKGRIKRKSKLPSMLLHENPRFMKNGIRCRVEHLGCIQNLKSKPGPSKSLFNDSTVMVRPEMTLDKCFTNCSELGYEIVGIQMTFCVCIGSFSRGKQINVWPLGGCNSRCPGNPEQTCGGERGIDVYRIAFRCIRGPFLEEHAMETVVGCFPQPNDLDSFMNVKLYSAQLTSIKCVIACEEINYPLAIIPDETTCYCSSFNKGFNVTSPLSSKSCDHMCSNSKEKMAGTSCSDEETEAVSVFRTFVEDKCGHKQYLTPGSVPAVTLASVPGSGNSWVRYLLELASGIYTGSVYTDQPLTSKGFFGEMDSPDSGRTLVVKDHVFHKNYSRFPDAYKKAIVIIRDPYDSIEAEFNRRITRDHVGLVPKDEFSTEEWEKYVRAGARAWSTINLKALKSNLPTLMIVFDDLKRDYTKELRRMLQFIGYIPTDLEARLLCINRNGDGYFKRKKDGSTQHAERYSPQQKFFINKIIKNTLSSLPPKIANSLPDWKRN